jgi:beta-phosphoglucomutase
LTRSLQAVLWDLDGVIVDTDALHYESWQAILPKYDLFMSLELHQKTFGMNNTQILSLLRGQVVSRDYVLEVGGAKEAYFRELVAQDLHPMAGVEEWLGRFKEWGLKQAIASSAPIANIETILATLEYTPLFQSIISGHDLPAKPDPTVYLTAANSVGVDPVYCVVIEDALVGIEGALNAGMRVIGVATTFPVAALEQADLVLSSMEELTSSQFASLCPR